MTTILFLDRLVACLLRSKRLLQRCSVHRQLAHAFAGRRKDRVGDCGSDGRSPGFAHPARRLGTPDNVDLDDRRLVDAEELIGIEIALLDPAALQRDLAIARNFEAQSTR